MRNDRIEKLLARQRAIKDALREETRHAKVRKQKALFGAVKRAGLLDLNNDEIEAALQAYQTSLGDTGNDSETES